MNFAETLFLIQLIVFISVFLLKVFNVMSVGQFTDWRIAITTLILALFSFGVGLVLSLLNYTDMLFIALFQVESWLLAFVVLLFIAELMFAWGDIASFRNVFRRSRF